MRGPVADVLLFPVVCGMSFVIADTDEFHNRVENTAVIEPQGNRVGLDMVELVLKVFVLGVGMPGSAGKGTRAVDASPAGVPDPVTAFVQADLSVFIQIENPAFNGIHHPGKRIFPREPVEVTADFLNGIFRRFSRGYVFFRRGFGLLMALFLIHPLIRFRDHLPERVGILHMALGNANGDRRRSVGGAGQTGALKIELFPGILF